MGSGSTLDDQQMFGVCSEPDLCLYIIDVRQDMDIVGSNQVYWYFGYQMIYLVISALCSSFQLVIFFFGLSDQCDGLIS